jgi:hypothetical protein
LSCPTWGAFGFLRNTLLPVLKKLLVLSILSLLGFFGWKHFTASPAPSPAPSPEQEVAAKLKISFQSDFGKKERWGGPASFRFQKRGKEIYAISVMKPILAQDKPQTSAHSPIDNTSEGAALQSIVRALAKAYGGNSANRCSKKSESSTSPAKPAQRVLCKEGTSLTLRGEFRHIGAGWIKCDLLELP